ncbi:hypothetical protein E3N88_29354 [Mikania micrantha]|uniref:Uncharacterized protein n=1 Tax=Mikania micrantha TaxID=192012 RepID=A0A5N6MIJ6_9ASTR|nr:hypothetical protein E3N88_29354 [Mikania micrantha]
MSLTLRRLNERHSLSNDLRPNDSLPTEPPPFASHSPEFIRWACHSSIITFVRHSFSTLIRPSPFAGQSHIRQPSSVVSHIRPTRLPPKRPPPTLSSPQQSPPHSPPPSPPPPPLYTPPHQPPPNQELDPATIALVTMLNSQLREVILEMMNIINSNNNNNTRNSSREGIGNSRTQ